MQLLLHCCTSGSFAAYKIMMCLPLTINKVIFSTFSLSYPSALSASNMLPHRARRPKKAEAKSFYCNQDVMMQRCSFHEKNLFGARTTTKRDNNFLKESQCTDNSVFAASIIQDYNILPSCSRLFLVLLLSLLPYLIKKLLSCLCYRKN